MPRATMYRNVGVVQYDRYSLPGEIEFFFRVLGMEEYANREKYQHAYFPRWAFDQVNQTDHWTFGKKDNGYIALYSYKPTVWKTDYELYVESNKNVWIVEMGSEAEDGSYEEFMNSILSADLNVEPNTMGYDVYFNSPSQGAMSVAWEGSFMVDGEDIAIENYKRYENKYCSQEFGTQVTRIEFNGSVLELDFENAVRTYTL